jgi:hypothetical protein
MKTVTLYHGTSADNLPAIRSSGFDGERGRQIWNCSGGANYFWNVADVAKSEDIEDDSEEYKNETAFRRARESAECGLVRAVDCRRVVFKLEIPEEFYLENFEPDNSCDNMSGAVVCSQVVFPEYITEIWIDKESLCFFRAYFASLLIDHRLAEELELTSAERMMINAIKKSDCGYEIVDSLEEMQMEKIFCKIA